MEQGQPNKPTVSFLIIALTVAVSFASETNTPVMAAPLVPQQGSKSPQTYADSYNALMQAYRARMVALTSRPLPPNSLPKNEWRAKMAGQIDDIATATAGFARRLDALKPPPSLRQTHAATRAYFQISAAGSRRVAAAVRAGVKDNVDKALSETEQAESKAVSRIADACVAAGADAAAISPTVQALTTGAAPQ